MEKLVLPINKEFGPDFSKLSQKVICSSLSHLALVEDPRTQQGSRHIFTDIRINRRRTTIIYCFDIMSRLYESFIKP